MNGYEFVKKILGHTNYDVTPLVKITGGLETDWLEFKGATAVSTKIYNKEGELYSNKIIWKSRLNVFKALIAMANGTGGAILIGIGEDENSIAEAVSLKDSGFIGDKDDFVRKLEENVLYPKRWKTPKPDLFKPMWGTFNEKLIIIVFVEPRKKEDKWLTCKEDNKVRERRQGDIGKTIEISINYLNDWWKSREIDRSDLNQRFISFLSEWNKMGKHNENIITNRLNVYIKKFKSDYEKTAIPFISLYAQNINHGGSIPHSTGQPEDVLELLGQNKGLILLGDPGSGKSTCLHRKVFLAATSWKVSDPWLLLIALHEYTELGLRSLILKKLPDLYWIDIEDKVASGKIIFFFDALNECPTTYYNDCHQEINSLFQDYPSAKIIVSSRLTHVPDFNKKLNTFGIRHMNRNQQQKFLDEYLHDNVKSANFLNRLEQQNGAKLIASSPVLLKMVIDIDDDGRDLPTGLAKLYQCSFEVWHQRESEKNAQNGDARLWSFNRVRDALALLAFSIRIEGKVSCNVNFARDSLERVMGNDAARFLDRIAQGLLLEVDNKDEFLHFSHETIQEYLVAEYLASHPDTLTENLLQGNSGKKTSNWAMPLVFAFELIRNPSKNFLNSAWIAEPLLVAAALRDNHHLASLPIYKHEDPWLRGVLRVMRNEDASSETHDISYISHTPPKYPLPTILVAALRGESFWYSAQSHPEGLVRLERLRNLIFDRSSMWIELVPYVDTEQLKLENISPAQQILMGKTKVKYTNTLKDATVSELCTLLRFKKIKPIYFKANWENSLELSSENQLPFDLIALLRTNAKLGRDGIKISQFNNIQKKHLRKIGENWALSFRLLNILIREKIIIAREIREEAGRLKDIIPRMSAMNMFRFMKNGVMKSEHIPISLLNELLTKLKPEQRKQLRELGCITDKESISSQREKIYSAADLENRYFREKIETEIRSIQWEVTILRTFPKNNYGFVKHPRFKDNAIFWLNSIKNPNNKSLVRGDVLKVGLEIKFNNKKEIWGFSVISGSILRKKY